MEAKRRKCMKEEVSGNYVECYEENKRNRDPWMSQCGDFEYFGKDSSNVLEDRSLTELMERKWDGSRDSGV